MLHYQKKISPLQLKRPRVYIWPSVAVKEARGISMIPSHGPTECGSEIPVCVCFTAEIPVTICRSS
jgi:hypothetical protein